MPSKDLQVLAQKLRGNLWRDDTQRKEFGRRNARECLLTNNFLHDLVKANIKAMCGDS